MLVPEVNAGQSQEEKDKTAQPKNEEAVFFSFPVTSPAQEPLIGEDCK